LASLKSLNNVKLDNINPNQRAETLSIKDWKNLADSLQAQ